MADDKGAITSNRKAYHEYHIDETLEAGIVLTGTEVKALRDGKVNLQDAYCAIEAGEMHLVGCHISPYRHGTLFNHEPTRKRKLLLHARELKKWDRAVMQKGFTIVPLKMYFKHGFAKVLIGLARGKKMYDKRATIAERDNQRSLDRITRGGAKAARDE